MANPRMTHEEILRLLTMVQTANVRDRSYHESETRLVRAGDMALPYLEELLRSDDPVTRDRAADIVAKIRAKSAS